MFKKGITIASPFRWGETTLDPGLNIRSPDSAKKEKTGSCCYRINLKRKKLLMYHIMVSVDAITLKSLKDSSEESDGFRILIARFRPRYLRKEDENWHAWWKELAPSKSLWKEYLKNEKIDWEEYSRKYKLEILENPLALKALDNLASIDRTIISGETSHEEQLGPQSQCYDILSKHDNVTLLCHCKDEKHCQRFLVKHMVK